MMIQISGKKGLISRKEVSSANTLPKAKFKAF